MPIYYRCGTFVSDKIAEKKVTDKWEIENDDIKKCFFKPRFWQSFSRQFSFKMTNIHKKEIQKNFEFEGKILNLAVTENFYFDISEEKFREYKLGKLLDGEI